MKQMKEEMKQGAWIRRVRIFFLAMLLCITPVFSGSALAAKTKTKVKIKTYTTSISRGIKGLCYSKDTVNWKSDGSKITSYTGTQKRSGILVTLNGIKKNKSLSTKKKFALLCKHTLQVGAVYKGITLGWVKDVNDMLYIQHNGASSVKWDY